MNFSTLCTILVTFGPETPEFTLLKIAPFGRYSKNQHITSNISEYPGLVLTYFAGLVDVLVRMIIPMFVLAVTQGMLLWQPVKFRGWSQTSPGPTFTPHFSVQQGIGRS